MATATTSQLGPHHAVVDIELTSRCNADCSFCPRDETPHQGLISEPTFAAALRRAVEYRDALVDLQRLRPGYFDTAKDTIWLSFCGMGEPLLHPRAVEYVGRVADAGLRPIINTNGALLSADRGEALLDAGLAMACVNVGEVGDDYEAVYGLPFERTRANVEQFLDAAAGRSQVVIVLVDHRDDPDHAAAMRDYWAERGAEHFLPFSLVNRAGALATEPHATGSPTFRDQAEAMITTAGAAAHCWVPFLYPFIGYDGHYYLCSSDWRKQVDLGNVVDHSLVDLFDEKLERVRTRSPICSGCTHEPTNSLARALEHAAAGSATDAPPGELMAVLEHHAGCVAAMRAHMPTTDAPSPRVRRLIPVRS